MRVRNNAGFSLGELITVMGILTVLAAIAIPNYIDWRNNAQLGRAARDVYSIMGKAKSEAAKRNLTCTVTFSANDFVVYVDANSDWIYDAGEEIIGPISWNEYPGVSLDAIPFIAPVGSVAFAPDGLPRDNGGGLASQEDIDLVGANAKQARIRMEITGALRINPDD